jgi:hypothetical protein
MRMKRRALGKKEAMSALLCCAVLRCAVLHHSANLVVIEVSYSCMGWAYNV